MSGEILSIDPANIAEQHAINSVFQPDHFGLTFHDEATLSLLENSADELGFLQQPYFVETSRALSIPGSFEADEPVVYGNFYNLTFEGKLVCYSKVMVGKVITEEEISVRALCLTFDEVTLLPYFDSLQEDRLLHIPVLAVNSIDQTS